MTNQLTQADVDRLYAERRYEEIEDARVAGRLNVLLGGEAPIDPDQTITDADITRLYSQRRYDEIEELRQTGRLDHLLNPTTEEN
ncbi:hypothetical protein [Cellulomonas sp. P24]|uniref:hypothetical protein n=1 Tax=Cellulomonas sp. P24 TaxID=2885206 RepID=UPI00216B54C9|nr:hypothetical protein [Cellulomonas sp. P24]MCR6491711.1 hypothetical protein [Cellulomonas sp. P24]